MSKRKQPLRTVYKQRQLLHKHSRTCVACGEALSQPTLQCTAMQHAPLLPGPNSAADSLQ